MNKQLVVALFLIAAGMMFPFDLAHAAVYFSKTMNPGDRGVAVSRLQTFLKKLPGVYSNGKVIGKYGPATTAAVKRFQTQYALRRTGRVDRATLEMINRVAARLGSLASGRRGSGAPPPGPPPPPLPPEPAPPRSTPLARDPYFRYSWRASADLAGEIRVPVALPRPVVTFDGAPIQIPATGAAARLANQYQIYLADGDAKWDDATSSMLLEMLRRLPQTQFGWGDAKPWRVVLTNDSPSGDFEVTGFQSIRIARAAFIRSNPTLQSSPVGNADRVFYSNRLFGAVLKIFFNQDFLIKEAIESRYGIKLGYSEPRDEFQDFTIDEMQFIATVLEDLPSGYRGIPGLEQLVRRKTGMTNPTQPEAPAIAQFEQGYIEFMDRAFASGSADYTQRLVAHEMTHFLWEKILTSETKSQFNKLSGWYEAGKEVWRHKTTTNFVSVHATIDPLEDFAETVAYYIYLPDAVRSAAPEKYDFIKNVVDGYEYVLLVDTQFTFQVFNLEPDLTYPGKIMGVDVEVEKNDSGDHVATATLFLSPQLGDGARGASARITSPTGTYVDVTFDPVGGDRFTLRATFTISRYAANGFWAPDTITVSDQADNRRREGQHQFGWLLMITNPNEDLEAPTVEEDGISLTVTPGEKDQMVRVYATIHDQHEDGLSGRAYLVQEASYQRIHAYATYDAPTRRLIFEYPIRTYQASGVWTFRELNVFDSAGNGRRIDLGEKSKMVQIETARPDRTKPEIDVSKIAITGRTRFPEAPNGETDVTISYSARDDNSGLGLVTYQLLAPDGKTVFDYHYHENFYTPYFEGDPNTWRRYQIRLTLPAGSIPGIWALSEIVLKDKAENTFSSRFVETGVVRKFQVL